MMVTQNQAKQHAAETRFREIDERVRSDITRLLARSLSGLLGDSLEKVVY